MAAFGALHHRRPGARCSDLQFTWIAGIWPCWWQAWAILWRRGVTIAHKDRKVLMLVLAAGSPAWC
jgi:hypothetical protein